MTRVAVDLLGGDGTPDGVLDALADDPALTVALCGPADVARRLLAERAEREPTRRVDLVHAGQVVGMDEDPAGGVRCVGRPAR